MPSHWAPMLEDVPVQYVELPLPPDCSPATGGDQTMRASTPPLDESTLKAMEFQVSRNWLQHLVCMLTL